MRCTLSVRFSACLLAAAVLLAIGASSRSHAEMTLRIADYVKAPMTGVVGGTVNPVRWTNDAYLARLNFLSEEPGGDRNRFFVNDLNGPLYILDQTTKAFTPYLNFNGATVNGVSHPGMFQNLYFQANFAAGLITFQFDPDYANNGKFYTVHMENASPAAPALAAGPVHTVSYTTTPTIDAPGGTAKTTVLLEWTDTNIANNTFEGSARELFRMDMQQNIHPMGDIIFNPNANPGDADWRMMYIAVGDGGAGEQSSTDVRRSPQRLDTLAGKVLRIRPDNIGATTTMSLSPNGQYYIPNDNPFTSIADTRVRDEIFTLGHRNGHRITWDPDTNTILLNEIGLHTWEEVNIIRAGMNYGYSTIEGNQVLLGNDSVSNDPLPAVIPRYITNTVTSGSMVPIYPVAQYGHGLPGQTGFEGDSISSGYVYRGANIPSLYGKYVFGEITTGQLFWCDLQDLIAADDGDPATMAQIHTIDIAWDNPDDAAGETVFTTITPSGAVLGPLFQIVEDGYEARGGQDPNLPGGAAVTGPNGRADIRIQVDEAGELYILSKSDGVIRYIVEALGDADFNGDDAIDGADFLIWQQNLGTAGGLAQGDADGDGRVTGADLGFWKQQFSPVNPPEAASVPEPTAAALAAFGLFGLWRRRRRKSDL
jgi:MYXO-CTERM domain-containing protein